MVKMIKNNKKYNPFFKIVLGVFILIFSFLAWNFITQNKYVFVFDCKWFRNDADIWVTVDWLVDLYTAFFLALLGIYFTIIGISFSLKQISILVFYEFTFFTKTSLATLIVFVLNVASIYCVLPNLRLTNAVVVYVFLSIVFCITVFCYFSSRIFYTDDEEWARQLFYFVFRKRKSLINRFTNDFLLKSFGKESPFVFFNINDSNSDTNAIFFELINIDEINDLKTIENFMIVVSLKIKECLVNLDKGEARQTEICNKYINAFVVFYHYYLFKLHGDTSFILYIRDAFLFSEEIPQNSERFFELYAAACKSVKDIIYLSFFYQKTDETIFAHINDYRYLNQFPRLYDNEKFNNSFNKTLVEISTYMFAIVIVGKHSNKIIPYAENLFLSIEKIDVDCMMPVMHEEGNFAKMGSYKVKYTQEFLVALILLYLMAKDCDFDIKKILKNKIRFVNYSFKKDENPLNLLKMGYSRFKSCVEKITVEEISNIKTISESDFRNTKEKFISLLESDFINTQKAVVALLESEIEHTNEKYKEDLKRGDFDDELNMFVESEKVRLQNDLKEWFSKVGDGVTYKKKSMYVEYSFLFSLKACKEKSEKDKDSKFSLFMVNWFAPTYISHSNLKYFKTFSELNFEKDSNLLLHIDYMNEVFDDKTIDLGVGCFRANDKEFKITYFRNGKRGLIYQNDFKRHFAVKEIIPRMDQTTTEETDDDFLVTVPVKIVFCEMDENPDFWILSK